MKSLCVSVFWPVWEWITHPERRWLFSSYRQDLSTRDSLKCRRLIQSPWYQKNWGHAFRLTSDQNVKTRFENDRTGYRIATTAGTGTGEGGDRIIVDDPHDVQDAESEAIRAGTLQWWDETMSTRGNDPKTAAKVIVMQRVHQEDLSGHVLELGGYEHLCLPAEFETDRPRIFTALGWTDPRREEDDLLWPERFDRKALDDLKKALGSPYAIAGQLQQRPSPREGGFFKRHWFEVVGAVPAKVTRVRYWDKAGADVGKGDWTAGVLMAKDEEGLYYIEDVVRVQLTAAPRNALIRQTAEMDRERYGKVVIHIEQPPGLAKESTDEVIRLLAGFTVHADKVSKEKVERAEPLSSQAEAGNVKLVAGDWNLEFLKELEYFPMGKHDDQVDAASGAFNKLAERKTWTVGAV